MSTGSTRKVHRKFMKACHTTMIQVAEVTHAESRVRSAGKTVSLSAERLRRWEMTGSMQRVSITCHHPPQKTTNSASPIRLGWCLSLMEYLEIHTVSNSYLKCTKRRTCNEHQRSINVLSSVFLLEAAPQEHRYAEYLCGKCKEDRCCNDWHHFTINGLEFRPRAGI